MNVEQNEYLPNITAKAGVRVVIHPQTQFPFPEDVGVDVSVGMSTSIGLKKVYLKLTQTMCVHYHRRTGQTTFTKKYNPTIEVFQRDFFFYRKSTNSSILIDLRKIVSFA